MQHSHKTLGKQATICGEKYLGAVKIWMQWRQKHAYYIHTLHRRIRRDNRTQIPVEWTHLVGIVHRWDTAVHCRYTLIACWSCLSSHVNNHPGCVRSTAVWIAWLSTSTHTHTRIRLNNILTSHWPLFRQVELSLFAVLLITAREMLTNPETRSLVINFPVFREQFEWLSVTSIRLASSAAGHAASYNFLSIPIP